MPQKSESHVLTNSWLSTRVTPALCAALFCCLHGSVTVADQPPVFDTQRDPPRLTTPLEALAAIQMPDGFHATLFAAEPEVRQPIAIATDHRGRLWVAENYTYAESSVVVDERHRDRILVLEDRDNDGRCDRRTIFWDQARELTSVEVGFGGVWAMCPPQLLFLPDRNGDDRFDGQVEIMLDGFHAGEANHHNFANGLRWGPDGWLYGRNGITHVGQVGAPGSANDERVEVGPGIWRFHPISKRFEVVCTGTTNPWGHDWNEHGELFFINTVIGHLWHAVPGAHFNRMFGVDSNPHVYALLDQTADHVHWDSAEAWQQAKEGVSPSTDQAGGGHAHVGMMIYLGDNWPARYRGKLFTINMHGYRINCDRLERRGASYVGLHEKDFLFSKDPWFRGTELLYGPDGGAYLADWSDVGECHEHDGVHRSSGRIFKIRFGEKPPAARDAQTLDLSKLSDERLVALQLHPNDWFVRQTRRLLQERAAAGRTAAGVIDALMKQYVEHPATSQKLRALWALHATGELSESWLLEQLSQEHEALRVWAVRLLRDRAAFSRRAFDILTAQAANDESGLVLLYLASTLQRLPAAERWPLATALAARGEFGSDPVLPLMIWYGIEEAVPQQPSRAVELAISSQMPCLRRYVARRLTAELNTHPQNVNLLLSALADLPEPRKQRDILAGMEEALRGWRRADAPTAWQQVYEHLRKSSDTEVQKLVHQLGVVFGDGRALDQLREIAASDDNDLSSRSAALRSLIDAHATDLLPLLRDLLSERELAPHAVRGIAILHNEHATRLLLDEYQELDPPGCEAVVTALSARPQSAVELLAAVAAGVVDRGHLAVHQIRHMQGYDDPQLQSYLQEIWPELRPISADKRGHIAELKDQLSIAALRSADQSAGRLIWEKSCGNCHTLYGRGGKIGPDLTGAQRSNLDYLLENVVDPSATLAPQFRVSTITLIDGRVISGVVLSRTDETWEVQTPTEKLVLQASEVDEAIQQGVSLMPEGLLDVLGKTDVCNLIAYLMSGRQVPLPTGEVSGGE